MASPSHPAPASPAASQAALRRAWQRRELGWRRAAALRLGCCYVSRWKNGIGRTRWLWKISFGGIPNSRNVLFLQIFLKRAAKPSAGNTSARFPWAKWTWPGLPSATFPGTRWTWITWLGFARSPVDLDLALHQSLPDLVRNLLRIPVEPDLALRQSFPHLLRNLLRNAVEPDPALHQSLPGPLWNLLRNPVEPDLVHQSLPEPSPDLALHQSLRDLLRNLPRDPVKPDLTLHQSLRDLLRNLPRDPVKPDLTLHQSLPDLLRNLLRNPVEPHPGACTSAHRSYSGLKIPLAYAVGEQRLETMKTSKFQSWFETSPCRQLLNRLRISQVAWSHHGILIITGCHSFQWLWRQIFHPNRFVSSPVLAVTSAIREARARGMRTTSVATRGTCYGAEVLLWPGGEWKTDKRRQKKVDVKTMVSISIII